MSNLGNWPKKSRNEKESKWSGRGRRDGKGPKNNRRQNKSLPEGGVKQFRKFADTNRKNKESNYWTRGDPNTDRQRNDRNINSGPIPGAGIFRWIRKEPVNQLVIPQHITFDKHYECEEQFLCSNETINKETERAKVEMPEINDKQQNVCNSETNPSITINPVSKCFEPGEKPSIQIKQEKGLLNNLKQEKKSSSSSSSTESSSSEEEVPRNNNEIRTTEPELATISKPSTSLNIRLKPKANSINPVPVKINTNVETTPKSSSSSSSASSSSEDESTPLQTVKQQIITKELQAKIIKVKNSSEDDVVCIGNLENKIILEDEEDHVSTESDEETEGKSTSKTTVEKTATEKCMICDKKGHCSFQCQMICKNCSAPYHGYRTCPQPANLNTMMQLFIQFCIQQFQNFNAEKQIATNHRDSIPTPQDICPPHLISNTKKSNNQKRKKVRSNESNAKRKSSKKHKISIRKRRKCKADSDNSSDDSNSEDDNDSESSSTEFEKGYLNSSAETLISSKRRKKIKSKNISTPLLNLSNFSTNPVNLPMVLNGFPNLTVPHTSTQNTDNSATTLNTLLLTQMFQNAIGSLKK